VRARRSSGAVSGEAYPFTELQIYESTNHVDHWGSGSRVDWRRHLLPEGEPNKVQIFVATILKGLLVALLIGLSLKSSQGMLVGGLYGLVYGSAFGLVVFLAKGASFRTTPYLLSGSAVQGIATGILIASFAFK